VAGGERVKEAMDFFIAKGWSPAQAAGIVARLHAESGLRIDSHNSIKGGHTGIAQWDSERWPRFLRKYGGDTSFQKQLEYVDWELNGPEAVAGRRIRLAQTASDAAVAMESYERAANPAFTLSTARRAQGLSDRYVAAQMDAKLGTTSKPSPADAALDNDPDLRNAYWKYNQEHRDAMVDWTRFKFLMGEAARRRAGVENTVNNNGHTVSVNNVEIHTQAKDADGIAGSFSNALQRKILVNQVNTGLE
jgi:hypothetical protein